MYLDDAAVADETPHYFLVLRLVLLLLNLGGVLEK